MSQLIFKTAPTPNQVKPNKTISMEFKADLENTKEAARAKDAPNAKE